MRDAFDATRVAAVEFGEQLRQSSEKFSLSLASFRDQFSDLGGSTMAGLQQGFSSLLNAVSPVALVFEAVGKVMEGFQPVIDDLMGPLVALGQIIGELITPILQPLFQGLKLLGIAVALVGEVVYTVAAGIADLVGGLIVAIGKFIAKIPFLGGVGHGIEDAGNAIKNAGASFSETAKELDQSRRALQALGFDDAANGLNNLTGAATTAAANLLNVPNAFKINLEKYRAQDYAPPPGSYQPPGGSPAPPDGSTPIGSQPGGPSDPNAPNGPTQITGSRDIVVMMDGAKVAEARTPAHVQCGRPAVRRSVTTRPSHSRLIIAPPA